MPAITLSNGARFISEPGESLLDAAARSGVILPYSCRKGRCSSCKCRAIRGESTALTAELSISEGEKADGWILSCARSAATDMTIEVDDLIGVEMPPVKTLPCRIHSLEAVTDDIVKVALRLPPNSSFAFLPGQYIDIIARGGIHRSYSLANTSAANDLLELHVRSIPGGVMSEYWFRGARVNDVLRFKGPLGTFFLRDTAGINLIFLATGTGIAPVKSMLGAIDWESDDGRPSSVTVYWGGRSLSELYWNVSEVPGAHRYVPVLSRADGTWCGAHGYVQQAVIAEYRDFSSAIVYACGSDAMIHGAKTALLRAGLSERRFYADAFVSSASG